MLESWKEFFNTGTNWKDLGAQLAYRKYLEISDKERVKNEGSALALRDELADVIGNPVFAEQMKDVMEYRVMDYYQRRYRGGS